MAGPTITVAILGDSKDAERAMEEVGDEADEMAKEIKRASKISADALESIDDGASNTEKGMRGLSDGINGATDVLGTFGVTAGGTTGQVVGLIGGFADLSAFVADFVVQLPPLLARMGILTAATTAQTAATGAQTTAQYALNTAFLSNPIFLVVAAILALTAAFVVAWKESETFREIVTGAFNAVKGAAVTVVNWIKEHWPELLAVLTGPIGLAVLAIVKYRDDIVGFFQKVPDKLKAALLTVEHIVTTPFRVAGEVVGKIFGAIPDAFKGAINTVIRALNSVKFSIDINVPDWLPGVPDRLKWSWNGLEIPELAQGGIVTRPTLALIGEAGPEAVIPLNRGPIGTTIINMPQGYRTPREVTNAVKRWERRTGGAR